MHAFNSSSTWEAEAGGLKVAPTTQWVPRLSGLVERPCLKTRIHISKICPIYCPNYFRTQLFHWCSSTIWGAPRRLPPRWFSQDTITMSTATDRLLGLLTDQRSWSLEKNCHFIIISVTSVTENVVRSNLRNHHISQNSSRLLNFQGLWGCGYQGQQ